MPGKAWSSRWIDAQVLKHAARTIVAATVPMLKARAYHRTRSVKLARTIADLAACEEIQSVHLAALTVCFAKALHASRSAEVDAGIGISVHY